MSNYTMSPVVNGEKKQMIVKVGDTLPIGAIIGFDTTGTIPDGWEYYAENQIKKIAPVTPVNGNIKNTYGTSQTDTYAQEYINGIDNKFDNGLLENIDLNTIKNAGMYTCRTIINGPIAQNNSYGNLLVISSNLSSSNYVKQIYINNYASNNITIAYRHSTTGNTWGEWITLH